MAHVKITYIGHASFCFQSQKARPSILTPGSMRIRYRGSNLRKWREQMSLSQAMAITTTSATALRFAKKREQSSWAITNCV